MACLYPSLIRHEVILGWVNPSELNREKGINSSEDFIWPWRWIIAKFGLSLYKNLGMICSGRSLLDMGVVRQAVHGGIMYTAVNASIKKDEKSNKAWRIRVITVSS